MTSDPNCRKCDLWSTAQHVCIGGQQRAMAGGSLSTQVMVLGEAPGYNEDVSGEPFVGESGKKLANALASVGIPQAFFTNTVRCRPPDNKLPKKSVGLCASYLDEEITEIKPTHILALGATAFQRLGGKGAITEQAGKEFWSEKYNAWVVPALHPAAILRAPGREDSWLHDLRHFAELVKGGPAKLPELATVIMDTPSKLMELERYLLAPELAFSYDFEATPIPIWHRNWKPYSIAFYFPYLGAAFVLPLQHPESVWNLSEHGPHDRSAALLSVFQDVKDAMQDPARVKVTHNDLYDACAWERTAGYFPHTTCDTMALAHLLDENRPKSLKWLGRTLLGWPDWDIDAKKEHPLTELAKYNAYDAYATFLLRERLLTDLAEDEHGEHMLKYFGNLVMPSIRAVGKMMTRGIYVDAAVLAERREECHTRITTTASMIPVENPNSSQQIAAWLYGPKGSTIQTLKKSPIEYAAPIVPTDNSSVNVLPLSLGLIPPHLTPGGKPSTDEAAINRLAMKFPEAKMILEHRKWVKNESTYFAPVDELIHTSWDGRAHFDYRSTSVETGRWGSRFHTQPRDPFVRSIFSAKPGHTLLSADYSQIEARIAAWKAAGSPATWAEVDPQRGQMLLAFRDGRDVYIETAAAALRKSYDAVTKDERQMMGKVPSLAMIYKISSEGFREYAFNQFEIVYSESEAQHLWQAFYARWPEIKAWHATEEKLIRARGYAVNPLGRIRHLPEVNSPDRGIAAAAIRSGINAPVQGCASNVLDAAHIVLETCYNTKLCRVVGIVHDDLLVEIQDKYVAVFAEQIRRTMVEEVPRALRSLGLHLPEGLLKVEMQVGPWGAGKVIE